MSEETKRAINAMAAYFELDPKEVKFWIRQWELSKLNKTAP